MTTKQRWRILSLRVRLCWANTVVAVLRVRVWTWFLVTVALMWLSGLSWREAWRRVREDSRDFKRRLAWEEETRRPS